MINTPLCVPARHTLVSALLTGLLTTAASPALAQVKDIGAASLTDLMGIEIQRVFGASERLQPVTEAPSAVTIVTAEDIRRYGYRTLGEVLQGVRGFYLTNDRNYSYVGVRGFARAGDYNTRVLLLVNGQRVNDNVYDQAPVGSDLDLDLLMVERVEVIRGPSSSLYGTSAFFGVINIITRSGADVSGTIVQAGAGSLRSRGVRAITGQRLPNGVDFVLGAAYEGSHGVKNLYFPVFDDDTSDGIARDLDGERNASLYGRLTFGTVTLTGGSGVRHKDVPTAAFGTAFNSQDPQFDSDDSRSFIGVQADRGLGSTRLSLNGSLVHYGYRGRYPYADPDGVVGEPYRDDAAGTRLTLSARATRTLPWRQTLSGGIEFTDNLRQDQWATGPEPGDDFLVDQSSQEGAIFVQDEVAVSKWLRLSGGLRFDDKGRYHRLTPRAAVIAGPSSTEVVKYLYGRAFRAPNAYELFYWGDRSASLVPETIDTHEVVWERYTGEWLRTSLAGYWYDAERLIALRPAPGGDESDLQFVNEGRTSARGVEIEAELRLKRGVQAFASYARQRSRDEQDRPISNSPASLFSARTSFGGAETHTFGSLELLRVGPRLTLLGRELPSTTLLNATGGISLGRGLSLVASARNLFDVRYSDPASDEHAMDAIEQNGRTLRIDLRWQSGHR